MEFELSFDPLNNNVEDFGSDQLGTLVDVYRPSKFPNLAEADVVIFTVPEFRGAGFESEKGAFFKIKNEFYKLFQGQNRLRIADLGFLKLGNKKEDTYQLLADVLQECNKRGLFALFLGGGQDLTISQYKSFAQSKEFCNMVCVDSKFDLDINNDNINSNSYLSSILNEESSVLFNFSNLGYQSYLVPNSSVDLLNKLFFDVHRIGEIRADFEDIEPVLRDANFVSLDLNSIKLSDFTAVFDGSPNGFTSEEICQLMRYAGIGNKLQSLGI
jgi:arginase family enzyme